MGKTLAKLIVILVLTPMTMSATGDSLNYLTPKDTIFLTINHFGEKLFEHRMERSQTLYSLGKFYGLSLEELCRYNPGLKDGNVSVGQPIYIPIPNRAILRYRPEDFDPFRYVPIYYIVKKGDTMFGIAKRHFRMEVEEVKRRNQLTSNELGVGQLLHMDWMRIEAIPAEWQGEAENPLLKKSNALGKIYVRERGRKREREQNGGAFWQKESKEDSDFYALHREAELNSIIQITNPMSGVTVYVKVIGKIPDTAYDDSVVVVLSPIAAKALEARDPQFYVRVKYY